MKYFLILAFALTLAACSESTNNENQSTQTTDSTQTDSNDLEVLIPVGGAVEQTTGRMR